MATAGPRLLPVVQKALSSWTSRTSHGQQKEAQGHQHCHLRSASGAWKIGLLELRMVCLIVLHVSWVKMKHPEPDKWATSLRSWRQQQAECRPLNTPRCHKCRVNQKRSGEEPKFPQLIRGSSVARGCDSSGFRFPPPTLLARQAHVKIQRDSGLILLGERKVIS